ncbi:MAG: PhoX family phosphatase [Planctomycetota bacterium]
MSDDRRARPLVSQLLSERLDRREILRGVAALTALQVLGGGPLSRLVAATRRQEERAATSLGFAEIRRGRDERLHVPEGYEAQVFLRWGDPVCDDAPPFDPMKQTAAAQSRQFGFNCDYIGYAPKPWNSRNARRGFLGVNHEFTIASQMLPGFTKAEDAKKYTRAHAEIELASLGFSVLEVAYGEKGWEVVRPSAHNRRITMLDTEIEISGPAAGHPRMRTKADPSGKLAIGTFCNCAGGLTPWGTFLSCEENFQDYFGDVCSEPAEAANHARYGLKPDTHYYRRFFERFSLAREPREPNRFGWVVEIDPHEPTARPVKRTALGRFRHEGAACCLDADGRVVLYSGDDDRGEYLYRFVTRDRFDPENRAANRDLLDAGTLSVARFDSDGRVTWLPLVHGKNGLTAENGFRDQGEVLIETRRAADLLGATPMDRPEDVETNPVTGLVYVMLTNNTLRGTKHPTDAANPRAHNVHGHVIELHPPVVKGARDHAADTMQWEMFLRGGDPKNPEDGADYQRSPISDDGWLSCPDNCTFDGRGRLWIATDGAPHTADGIYACDTLGPGRAHTKLFLRSPVGAEVCGPFITPDDRHLFCAIQHPGATTGSHFAKPGTRWPDFSDDLPARPSVVAIRRRDGGPIGD